MSGVWQPFAPNGDPIGPPHSTLGKAQAAIERRVGRKLKRTYEGDSGTWSFSVGTQRFWVLEENSSGFPPESGLVRKKRYCPDCFLPPHTGYDC
jgi:hypothetical protein